MKILGIETSCDETAAAIIEGDDMHHGVETRHGASVLSSVISSQIEIHKKYGGVVPEVAAREHVLNILPVIDEALIKAGLSREKILKGEDRIDAIAVTIGPGLITSLLAGIETAKVLSFSWGVPLIGVNHIEGHIYANFITPSINNIEFPAVVLTVSGGHNMLVLMSGHGKLKIIGETRDDAAGEAFDKAAAMLGIGYPGGPIISKYAKEAKLKENIDLPRPMINSKDYDFSFSGLKTALLYKLKKDPAWLKRQGGASKNWKKKIPEYACGFQQAVIDVLIKKTIKASREYKVKTIMLSGGVSANKELREQLKEAVLKEGKNFAIPDMAYTTDNAAMIAAAGYFKSRRKKFTGWDKIKVDCNAEF